MPRGATCSRPSKPITIVGQSTPLSATSPRASRPENRITPCPLSRGKVKAVRLPDALHRAQADACCLGDHAARPMGGLSGRLAAWQCQDFSHRRRLQRFLAGLARLVAQQPLDTLLGEALLPSPYRRPAGAALARHRQHRKPVGRQENDPSPLDAFLQPDAIADDRSQSDAILVAEGYRRFVPCPEKRTAKTPVNPDVCINALEFRVSAALSAPSGVRFFVACCHFRVTARPRSGRTL